MMNPYEQKKIFILKVHKVPGDMTPCELHTILRGVYEIVDIRMASNEVKEFKPSNKGALARVKECPEEYLKIDPTFNSYDPILRLLDSRGKQSSYKILEFSSSDKKT
jgi:hypothetical protein